MEQSGEETSVTALLRALCGRIQPKQQAIGLGAVVPVYERLLQTDIHVSDRETDTLRSLQWIRSVLAREPTVYDASRSLDDCLDRYFGLALTVHAGDEPLNEALRLLVCLAGGEDGETFVVEDPTRIDAIKFDRQAKEPRIGEAIRMRNDAVVAMSQEALFHKASLPLEPEAILGRFNLSSFKPTNRENSPLWYPQFLNSAPMFSSSMAAFQGSVVPQLLDFRSSDDDLKTPSTFIKDDVHPHKRTPQVGRAVSEVLFFDSTKVITAGASYPSSEGGSVTEASSAGDEDEWGAVNWSSFVQSEQVSASWEDLDNTLPVLPPSRTPLLERAVSNNPRSIGGAPLPDVEIDEADVIEDATKALCGIGSVIFRRVIRTASFRVPSQCSIKLRASSSSSLLSILQDVCTAATAFLRLEYLSVYYAQDPARGGKTTQAFATALRLYLTSYRAAIHTPEMGHASSLFSLLLRTRHARQQIIQLAQCIGTDRDDGLFWDLLTGEEFPRGVWLLNHLHASLAWVEQEDAHGHLTRLLSWLLVRAAAPFTSLLSCYIATGTTPVELDPYEEFQLSIESTLVGMGGLADAVDGSSSRLDLVPAFLEQASDLVRHIGHLQLLLSSILPHSDTLPLEQLRLPAYMSDAIVAHDQMKDLVAALSKRVEAACLDHRAVVSGYRRPVRSPTKSPRAEDQDMEWVTNKRKRVEQKRQDQQYQRQYLDEQVRDKHERQRAAKTADQTSLQRSIEHGEAEHAKRMEDGKQHLLAKYQALMAGADDRHQYMRWRRDRALRLPRAKALLSEMYETESKTWGEKDIPTPPVDVSIQEGAHTQVESEESKLRDGDDDMSANVEPLAIDTATRSISAANNSDAISDSGLLWKPRIRTRHVPGGGGDDAKAAMYPDTSSLGTLPAVARAPRPSVIVIAPSGGGAGIDAFESIYGPRSKQPDRHTTVAEDDGDDEMASAPGSSREEGSAESDDDVVMHEEVSVVSEQPSHIDHSTGPPTGLAIDADDHDDSDPVPIASLLQLSTPFFRNDVAPDDAAVLRTVFEQGSLPPSPPFSLLVRTALQDPIAVVHDALDRMALKALVTKLDIRTHLHWLHRITLMSEGLCMSIFASDLLAKLRDPSRALLGMPGRLTTMLSLAMIEARVVGGVSQLPAFEYRVSNAFGSVVATGPAVPPIAHVLDEVVLEYKFPRDLAVVLSAQTLEDYLAAHRFLMLTRLAEQEAKEIWLTWRKSPLRESTGDARLRRRCDLLLHSAQAFLTAFHESYTNQILVIRWNELCASLDNSQSVMQLRKEHERFAADARACCFQGHQQSELRSTISTLVDSVWALGSLLRAAETYSSSLESLRSQLGRIVDTQATAMRDLLSRLDREESASAECRRDFAKRLILRLNLNGFFKDTTT